MPGTAVKQLPRVLTLVLACALAGGCAASGFVGDRSRDAADILTLTVGSGGGGKIRLGPLQLAAFDNTDVVGLRGGQWFLNGADLANNAETYVPIPVFVRRPGWNDPIVDKVFTEQTGRTSDYRSEDVLVHSPNPYLDWNDFFGREVFSHGLDTPSSHRGKDVAARSPLPLLALGASAPFKANVEFAGGLIASFRFGINFGELLDYILGLGGVDIYGDDLGDSRPWESPVTLEVPIESGAKKPPFVRVRRKDKKGRPSWELVGPPEKRSGSWQKIDREPDGHKATWQKLDQAPEKGATTWKKLEKDPKRDVSAWRKLEENPKKDGPAWETVEEKPKKDVVSWKKVREIRRVEAIPGETGNERFRPNTATNNARSRRSTSKR